MTESNDRADSHDAGRVPEEEWRGFTYLAVPLRIDAATQDEASARGARLLRALEEQLREHDGIGFAGNGQATLDCLREGIAAHARWLLEQLGAVAITTLGSVRRRAQEPCDCDVCTTRRAASEQARTS